MRVTVVRCASDAKFAPEDVAPLLEAMRQFELPGLAVSCSLVIRYMARALTSPFGCSA